MLNQATKQNFETLQQAMHNGDTCVLDARDKNTGKSVALVCAVQRSPDGTEIDMVPLAVMIDGNPYEMYDPPK